MDDLFCVLPSLPHGHHHENDNQDISLNRYLARCLSFDLTSSGLELARMS